MSGDVQPRKRKDKKKRKDEGTENTTSDDDVNIHVHKEDGTGGNICAKIVFFILFSALFVLIGLIIKENQGLTDLDDSNSESRFSQIFEGWTDTSHHKNNEHHEQQDEILDISEEHEEIEGSEEEHILSDEIGDEHDDENDDDDDMIKDEIENIDEEENDEDVSIEDNEEDAQDEDDDDDDGPTEVSEEVDENNNVQSEEDTLLQYDHSIEKSSKEDIESSEKNDEGDEKNSEDLDVDDSEVDKMETEPLVAVEVTAAKPESNIDPTNENSSGMAAKLGVGAALLVVAYTVLIRKWKSAEPKATVIQPFEETPTPDLSRRNTIVLPPSLEEVQDDIEQDEDSSNAGEEISDDDVNEHHKTAKQKYEELQSTYTRSITPEFGNIADEVENEENIEEYEENEEDIEEEEEEEEDDDYDEDEDEQLLKRLEAKYGKLGRDVNVGSDNPKEVDSDDDDFGNITNKDDHNIKHKLDEGQQALKSNAAYANKIFDALLQKYPTSPRCLYGKAAALDVMAEKQRSNVLLQKAVEYYIKVLQQPDVPNVLYSIVAERCINRLRFMGSYGKSLDIHKQLIKRFESESKYMNELVVTYLTINSVKEARTLLKKILSKWPNDGFALVHYGFILKTTDNNLKDAVNYLTKGIETNATGVLDGRFFFHLGDALTRMGERNKAMDVYAAGVKHGLFLSKYQRSLYNVNRLTAKPWWEPRTFPYQDIIKLLQNNWEQIRDEGLALMNQEGFFEDESENLRETGDWKQFELFARGSKNMKNCAKCPLTCDIISSVPDVSKCKRGQTKFSVMHPGTHVWPHCGPTNCRLRLHLGLKVPSNTFIRVAEETRSWKNGEVMIFDDSFEHEVWHNGTKMRLVLIVDVWHPELTNTEKKNLTPI